VIPYVKVEISAMVQHNRYQQFMKTIEIKKFIDFHKVIEGKYYFDVLSL